MEHQFSYLLSGENAKCKEHPLSFCGSEHKEKLLPCDHTSCTV